MTKHINETKRPPCALLRRPVPKISLCTVIHGTGRFSVRSFSVSFIHECERQGSMPVETGMPNCKFLGTAEFRHEYLKKFAIILISKHWAIFATWLH